MNTQVGKSSGIALLLAAAFIAALFAMGVFAPAVVDAGIKGGSEKPMVELTDDRPAKKATATITFTTNEEVDGDTNNDVFVEIPAGLSVSVTQADYAVDSTATTPDLTADPTKLTVTQNGNPVGAVTISADNTIRITAHPTDSSKNLMAGVPTVITIIDLTTAAAGTYSVEFHQAANADGTASQTYDGVIGQSVLDSPAPTVLLSDDKASSTADDTDPDGDGPLTDADTQDPGENVTLTFTFTVDSSVGANEGAGHVVISIDPAYSLTVVTADFKLNGNDLPTGAGVTVADGADATSPDTITIISLGDLETSEDSKRYTLEVPGQLNPTDSAVLKATFQQGNQPNTTDNPAPMALDYVLKEGDADVEGTLSLDADELLPGAAVDMTLSFEAIQEVKDDVSNIMVTLNGVSGLMQNNIMVQAMDADGTYKDAGMPMAPMNNMFYIGKAATGGTNIMADQMVKVSISGLTLGMAGESISATVKQGGFAAGMVGQEGNEFDGPTTPGGSTIVTPDPTPDPLAPGAPMGLTVTTVDHERLSLSWNAPEDTGNSAITGYKVQYKSIAETSFSAAMDTDTDVSHVLTGLAANTVYQVRVAAANDAGTGAYVNGQGRTNAAPVTVVVPDRTPNGVDLSDNKAGAAVRIDIDADADAMIAGGEDIVVELPKFGLPSSISSTEVLIDSDGYVGNPSDVTVSGSKVTIEVPAREATSAGSQRTSIPVGDYSIKIKQGAGITNPVAAGDQTVKITDADATAEEYGVTIVHVVSLSAASVTRGDDLTLTLKGFANGTASVSINGTQVGQTEVSGNAGTFAIDTSASAVKSGQDNVVTVVDSTGSNGDGASDSFILKAKVSVDPDSTTPSKDVEISLSDWPANQRISMVSIGGIRISGVTASTDADGAATFDVMVPRDAKTGTQTLSVTGGGTTATTTIAIDVLLLTVSPSDVVPGAQVTISGSGFAKNTAVDADSFKIGGNSVNPGADATSTSSGNISITVMLPLNVGTGTKKVELAIGGRDGEGELTVPKPSVSIDPAESVPGSTISVTGSAFAANERVEVSFAGAIEEVGRADGNGDVSVRLTIPSNAGVGSSNEVMIKTRPASGDASVNISAKATHKTPGPGITVTAEARVGDLITISGTNFASYSQLTTVTVGGLNAMPSPAPETDKNGAFSFTARVPRIGAGSHTVTVRDNRNNSATESFEVVTTAVINTPEEVFGVLGDSLVSVWSLDNATKVWSAYFPGAPEGVSDLTGVSSRDIVWINVNADVDFQGGMLTTGWNLISLE